MNYITVKEAASRWSTAERTVQNYCANGKIPEVISIGGQWLIPAEAKAPPDGRTKVGKSHGPIENYRFPVFLYSRYYGDSDELTGEEKSLLEAQVLHFEGKHMESLILCQKLLKNRLSSNIRAGVYLTMGIDAFLLGLVSRYEEAVSMLEKLTARATEHREDFILMNEALKFYIDWASSGILKIQPSKLSSEAVWYYQTMVLTVSALSGSAIPLYTLLFWESELPFFEKEGMKPMLYLFLCGLGVLTDPNRTDEEREVFLKKGVELAIEQNWVPNLNRFYNFSPASLEKIVRSHGDSHYQMLMKGHKTDIYNWNILHSRKIGFNLTGTYTPKEMELLLLIARGYTEKEIALCLSLSKNAVKQEVKRLMEVSQTAGKAELRAFARNLYDTSFQAGDK